LTKLSTENKTTVFIRTSVYITQTLRHPPNLDSSPLSKTREENAVLSCDRSDLRLMCSLCAYFVDRNKISFVGSVKYFRIFKGWRFRL